jgi:hypothetical protein
MWNYFYNFWPPTACQLFYEIARRPLNEPFYAELAHQPGGVAIWIDNWILITVI